MDESEQKVIDLLELLTRVVISTHLTNPSWFKELEAITGKKQNYVPTKGELDAVHDASDAHKRQGDGGPDVGRDRKYEV